MTTPPDDPALEHAIWLFEGSGDAALITDLQGRIEYVNPAFEALTGYSREQVLGRTPAMLSSGRQSAAFYRELWDTLRAGREFRGVLVNRRRDGALFHEEETIRPLFDADGEARHYLCCGRDVSARVEAFERLRHAATHDALTGLPNRALYLDRLEQAVAQASRSGRRLVVALLDLNGFKAINDSAGHGVGDAVLQATARRLCEALRRSDTAARLGGDEFALLLHDADDAERVITTVMQVCSAPAPDGDGEAPLPLSVSIGVSRFPDDGDSAATLLQRADAAMYEAKRNGGAHCRWAQASEPVRVSVPLSVPMSAPMPVPAATASAAMARGEPAADPLELLQRELPVLRRVLRPGDSIYRAGERFRDIHVVRVGLCKLSGYCADGREDLITIVFKGDWLGFDGLADGRYRYAAVAAEFCELLTVGYDSLLRACARNPALLAQMHAALARQHARERDAVLCMHALPADGRVAAFLCRWADELAHCGLRSDQITLPTTRAEIGGHVGLRLESVSRAMSNLERQRLIRFGARGRRDIEIPDLPALRGFVNQLADSVR